MRETKEESEDEEFRVLVWAETIILCRIQS